MTYKHKLLALALTTSLFSGCNKEKAEQTAETTHAAPTETSNVPAVMNFVVVKTYPHDTTAFTEGLLLHNGQLFESTGSPEDMLQTRSVAGPVDTATGKIDVKEIDRNKYFGEGIVILNDKLYQLTYTTKVGFVYDAKTFKKLGEFNFPSQEGWGMTTDGTSLIMSDGTSTLTYLDPTTFKTVKTVNVNGLNGPVMNINELEYINGYIYANVYTTNYIIKIDPNSGMVVGTMDLSSLAQDAQRLYPNALEMNGIAYNPATKNLYVTGKFWPTIYELKFSQ